LFGDLRRTRPAYKLALDFFPLDVLADRALRFVPTLIDRRRLRSLLLPRSAHWSHPLAEILVMTTFPLIVAMENALMRHPDGAGFGCAGVADFAGLCRNLPG
jgi:hypothetical protein